MRNTRFPGGPRLDRMRPLSPVTPSLFSLVLGLVPLVGVLSCSGDTTTGAGPLSPAQAYWALQLNQHAVNLALTAPYDTMRLAAIPRNTVGGALSGLGPVTYTSTDSTVTVDSLGLLTAHYPTSETFVVATLQDRRFRVTHADTVVIQVTQTPLAAPDTFSLQPGPGDSAKRALDFHGAGYAPGSFPWPVHATDATGTTLCDATMGCPLLVFYTSSDPTVATIDRATGVVNTVNPGRVVLTATTWAYGVARRDSVEFTIGYKLSYAIPIALDIQSVAPTVGFVAPRTLIVGVGADITFGCLANLLTPPCDKPVDIVFDHPAAIDTASTVLFNGFIAFPPTGSGNIAAFGGDSIHTIPDDLMNVFRSRRFPVAGTYRYHSTLFPSETFEILVQKD